jgi:biopolymer transport protein ExbD
MRFGRRHRPDRVRGLEITPMIDVVFLLIIFFMTTARFAQDTRAELDLPEERGEQRDESEEAGVIINVAADGTIIVGKREVTIDELDRIVRDEIQRVRGHDPRQLRLTLRADRRLDSARLNRIVTLLREAGVGSARLATEIPQ